MNKCSKFIIPIEIEDIEFKNLKMMINENQVEEFIKHLEQSDEPKHYKEGLKSSSLGIVKLYKDVEFDAPSNWSILEIGSLRDINYGIEMENYFIPLCFFAREKGTIDEVKEKIKKLQSQKHMATKELYQEIRKIESPYGIEIQKLEKELKK